MVAVGGETVVDYSRRIKLQYGDQAAVWVAGYSNDVFAYLPSRRVLLEGGYESSRAMTYFTNPVHPTAFAPDVEERVMSLVETLVRKTAP